MRQVSTPLRAAIESGERIIDGVFTVDWDNDGVQDIDDLSRKVDSVSMNQSLESSLPAQVQLVPGVAVAEVTAKIARGNVVRYAVPAFFRQLTTSSVGTGTTTTWNIARPANAKIGDVMLVAIFSSLPAPGNVLSLWQVLTKSNVTWLPMAVRGDGAAFNAVRLEGLLLYRRVADNEPASYTITLPVNSAVTYTSAAVNIGDQNIMGITDFVQKGEDNSTTATEIRLPPVKVDIPGSTIVTFCAATSVAISGTGFTPIPTTDIEQTEFVVVGTTRPSIRMSVNTQENTPQGLWQKGVTITGSTSGATIATVGFSVVVAPKLSGDEAQHAAWTFSELNPDSPYAGKTRIRRRAKWALRVLSDNGMESIPLFTGYTTSPSGSSDRTITIKALDNREDMRNSGRGIDIAAEYPISLDTTSGSAFPTMPGLEATWMVSRMFFLAAYRTRAMTAGIFTYDSTFPTISGRGFFPSPLPLRSIGVWAPMHGSAHALVGNIQYAYTDVSTRTIRRRVAFDPGPFVAATRNEADGSSTKMSWVTASDVWTTSTAQLSGRFMAWINRNRATSTLKWDLPDNNATWDAWVEVLATGVVRLRVEGPGVSRTVTGPTIAADATWHFLGVHFESVAGSVTFRVDTTNTIVALTTWTPVAMSFTNTTVNVTLTNGMQLAEFHQYGGAFGVLQLTDPWSNENFAPTAFIDKSDNVLDVIPYIDPDEDGWSVVSDIAAAEFAAVFFDADGYPHYRTSRSDYSTTGQTIQKMLTARKTVKEIGYESGVMQIRNIISVPYTPYVASVNKEIFSASGVIIVNIGQTQTFTVTVQGPILIFPQTTYTAFPNANGTGASLTAQVSVQTLQPNAGQVTILITNNSGSIAYLVDNTGQPNLHTTATFFSPLQGDFAPVTYIDTDSIREFGEQSLDTGSVSTWVQRVDSAASIALKLLSDLCQPHPAITQLVIKGDPTLEFGDLVTLVDKFGLGINGRYRITGKDPQLTPGDGFVQSLVVRSAPDIAFWDTNFWDDGTVWG